MKAIIQTSLGHAELVNDRPLPKLRDGFIMVKTVAVALNPIDWMKIDGFPSSGTLPLQGHDYSGVVHEVGKNVTKFQKGDKVCGYILGGNALLPENGAFAEYIVAKADLQFHIPDGVSFEEAAAIGAGAYSVGVGLYMRLQLKLPLDAKANDGEYLLIYGGSTASGVLGVQLGALSGYKVIAICSEKNFEYVKSLGAEQVFDYRDPNCGKLIREYSKDQLELVWDTIAVPQSAQICAEAMSTEGGHYCCLLPVEFPRSDAHAEFMDVSTSFGDYYEYGPMKMPVQVDSEAVKFANSWRDLMQRLWDEKQVRVHEIEVGNDGLKGIFDGLERLRNRQVSAKKLVYRVEDTP